MCKVHSKKFVKCIQKKFVKCIKKSKKDKKRDFGVEGWEAKLKHRRILFSLHTSRSTAVGDLRVNSLRSLATASFPSIRRLTVALKVLLSYKHWVTQFFFLYFFSGIHLMSFFLWAIKVESYCKRHWENVYKQLAANPSSDSNISNFPAGRIYKRLSCYELFDYILEECRNLRIT